MAVNKKLVCFPLSLDPSRSIAMLRRSLGRRTNGGKWISSSVRPAAGAPVRSEGSRDITEVQSHTPSLERP